MTRRGAIHVVLGLGIGLLACTPQASLRVSYGEWEPLGPGTPRFAADQLPTVREVRRDGDGPALAIGDVAELRLRTQRIDPAPGENPQVSDVRRWIWVGFLNKGESDFSSGGDESGAALIGQKQGSVLTFAPAAHHAQDGYAGGVSVLLFGAARNFFDRLPGTPAQKQGTAIRSGPKVETSVEILRICKGPAVQRLVTLLDDSPISVAQDLGRTFETREPRWMYLREAKWEGSCNDGAKASFQFGPIIVEPPPGKTKGLNISTLWEPWLKEAWSKLPIGVVVK